jgi:hypothetical protein
MANRFYSPNQQLADNTGAPYAGGSLAFYASGTSTPLATYSDSALTIANTNPVILDSAGRAGNIFLQNLAYKVVLSDVNSNVIWTDDPVYSSDYSARAKLLTGSGSPNGNTAGTAGSAGIGADTYWDSTNNILYVCTTTGNAASAVWTAVNASTAASVVPPPLGYLTPTSGVPIINAGYGTGEINTAATTIYYTPYLGNLVPIYNGSSFVPTTFSELILTLSSSHAASNIYDVFVFNNSGVPTLVTGPSWSAGTGGSITAGSCARGTGAGGAALSRVNGLYTNAVQFTGRNGATTYTINASLATYLGSIFIDGANGQVSLHRTYGQSRKWGISNAYNRVPVYLKGGDGTASWPYTSTIRVANGNINNNLSVFNGLPEEVISASYQSNVSASPGSGQNTTAQVLIGFNTQASGAGKNGQSSFNNGNVNSDSISFNLSATYKAAPILGVNIIYALESGNGSTAATTFFGTEGNMLLTADWRA